MNRRKTFSNNICNPIIPANVSPNVISKHWSDSSGFVLDEFTKTQLAALYSLDRLKTNATTPVTLSFSDASPNMIVPFSNNSINKSAVESYITRNRVVNPTLTINTGGVADNWTAEVIT